MMEHIFVLSEVPMMMEILESTHLDNRVEGCPIIDSGATSSLVGLLWLKRYFPDSWNKECRPSDKKFRFGDARIHNSCGETDIVINTPVLHADGNSSVWKGIITADVLEGSNLPLLISRVALRRIQGRLDFTRNRLWVKDGMSIDLILGKNGHLYRPRSYANSNQLGRKERFALVGCEVPNKRDIDFVDGSVLRKLHLRLTHGNLNTMRRILDSTNRPYDVNQLKGAIAACTFRAQDRKLSRPLVQSYIPPFAGCTLCSDIFYPLGTGASGDKSKQRTAYLLVARMLCRFVMIRRLLSLRPENVIAVIVKNWFYVYGREDRILTDRGPGYCGDSWKDFSNAWACQMVQIPTGSPHSNGLAERQIDMIKTGFHTAKEMYKTLSAGDILQRVALARNLTPLMAIGRTPFSCMAGRDNLIAPLENDISKEEVSVDSEDLAGQVTKSMGKSCYYCATTKPNH